jgi:hypothetical protein
MANKTINGCVDFSVSPPKIKFVDGTCNYCGKFIFSGVHAGQIEVTINSSNSNTGICDDSYYGCVNFPANPPNFKVTIPDNCCCEYPNVVLVLHNIQVESCYPQIYDLSCATVHWINPNIAGDEIGANCIVPKVGANHYWGTTSDVVSSVENWRWCSGSPRVCGPPATLYSTNEPPVLFYIDIPATPHGLIVVSTYAGMGAGCTNSYRNLFRGYIPSNWNGSDDIFGIPSVDSGWAPCGNFGKNGTADVLFCRQ